MASSSGLPLQVRWEDLTHSVIADAVRCARAWVLLGPPDTAVPERLKLHRGGTFLWHELENRPSHPACRVHGEYPVTKLQRGRQASFWQWHENGGCFCLHNRELGAVTFSNSVHHFVAARPGLSARVRSLAQALPAWHTLVAPGTWLYAEVDGAALTPSRQEGYHGTSMHALERVLAQAMETGWSGGVRRSVLRLGVYYHVAARAHLCHNYMLHWALDDTGFLISAMIHMSAPMTDPQGRMVSIMTSGQPQSLTYADVAHVHGIWFHIVHVLALWHGASSDWLWAEPRYAQHLEVDPLLERADLESSARARAARPS